VSVLFSRRQIFAVVIFVIPFCYVAVGIAEIVGSGELVGVGNSWAVATRIAATIIQIAMQRSFVVPSESLS
jgi:hypothetical protein